MLKRISILSILIVIALSCLGIAYGEGTVKQKTSVSYDAQTKLYIVKGSFENETRGNISVGLRIFKENGELFIADVTTAERNKAKPEPYPVEFEFAPISFETAESGNYKFEISSFLDANQIVEVYLKPEDKLTVMKKLSQNSGDTLKQIICDETAGLGVDADTFKELSDSSKNFVINNLKFEYDLSMVTTESLKTKPEDIELLNKAVQSFADICNEYIAAAAFNEAQTEAKAGEWLDNYAEKLGLYEDDTNTAYNEPDLWRYFEKAPEKADTLKVLKNMNDARNIDEVKAKVAEALVCAVLNNCTVTGFDKLLSDYSSVLGINISAYQNLDNKSGVRSGLIGKDLLSAEEFSNEFNRLVSVAQNQSQQGGSGTGGSGITSGSGGNRGAVAVTVNPNNAGKKVFNDLDSAVWAEEYIMKLYNAGIISGKAEGIFAPNDKITRAEFVKLVVEAFKIQKGGASSFADVTADKWYYQYVTAAAVNGIVTGDDNNCFKPDSFITRQDIAVILYRALNITSVDSNNQFVDGDDISDYAENAVSYFAAKGIINGYPDGTFAPKKNATRAESAKIIAMLVE